MKSPAAHHHDVGDARGCNRKDILRKMLAIRICRDDRLQFGIEFRVDITDRGSGNGIVEDLCLLLGNPDFSEPSTDFKLLLS